MGSVKSWRAVEVPQAADEVGNNTATASTLQELINTIPRSYQVVLGDHLTKKFRVAHKHANVQSTITMYERHDTDGSFPPLIRNSLKEPKLQFAKEFLQSTAGSESPDTFKAAVIKARKNTLDAAITEKKKELAHLASLIKSEPDHWKLQVDNVMKTIVRSQGGAVKSNDAMKLVFTGAAATAEAEYNTMWDACTTYTYRCLALARAAIDRADLQKLSKIKLKETTDVDMTDAPRDPPVRDIIREELKSIQKQLSLNNGKQRKPAARVQKRPSNGKTPGKKAKNGGKRKKGKKSR